MAMAEEGSNMAVSTEVFVKAKRRRFTGEYKASIVAQANKAQSVGEIGALLRREGLASSTLSDWRKAYAQKGRDGLDQKRGRRQKVLDPNSKNILALEKENEKLRLQLKRSELTIEIQKKCLELLKIEFPNEPMP